MNYVRHTTFLKMARLLNSEIITIGHGIDGKGFYRIQALKNRRNTCTKEYIKSNPINTK